MRRWSVRRRLRLVPDLRHLDCGLEQPLWRLRGCPLRVRALSAGVDCRLLRDPPWGRLAGWAWAGWVSVALPVCGGGLAVSLAAAAKQQRPPVPTLTPKRPLPHLTKTTPASWPIPRSLALTERRGCGWQEGGQNARGSPADDNSWLVAHRSPSSPPSSFRPSRVSLRDALPTPGVGSPRWATLSSSRSMVASRCASPQVATRRLACTRGCAPVALALPRMLGGAMWTACAHARAHTNTQTHTNTHTRTQTHTHAHTGRGHFCRGQAEWRRDQQGVLVDADHPYRIP